MLTSKIGNRGNLIFISFLIFIMLVPAVNSLVTYTATLVMTPLGTITISEPDSAMMLMAITAEKDADSGASSSADILNLLIDDDTTTGGEIIYNYAGNSKDICHGYTLESESSDYFKVEIRVYFSTLEVIPYDWRVYVYQSDRDNINKGYYIDGSSSGTGWTSIDVTSIIHQLDGQGFMKVRLISRVGQANEGKIVFVSEMEWHLTA